MRPSRCTRRFTESRWLALLALGAVLGTVGACGGKVLPLGPEDAASTQATQDAGAEGGAIVRGEGVEQVVGRGRGQIAHPAIDLGLAPPAEQALAVVFLQWTQIDHPAILAQVGQRTMNMTH